MSLDIWLTMDLDTGGSEPHVVELFSANITSNLNSMAEEAGIYKCLWRPGELWDHPIAENLIELLEIGLDKLKQDPGQYEKFNAPNGWVSMSILFPLLKKSWRLVRHTQGQR